MGPADLAQVLSGLPKITDEKVLVGTSTADDGAVYRISDDLAIIQTVDFFTPIVDSPYWFGAIAAANSLSDVYAMGGRPAFALNIVCFPRCSVEAPLTALAEVLRGGADKAAEAGIAIVGGHTVDDVEPKYGLVVTGFVHPDEIWTNVGGRPGDRLILTKSIGTGIVSTALRAGEAGAEVESAAVASMAMLNAAAAGVAAGFEVHACTDVTGFGLLGHLAEMLGDGGVGAVVETRSVPLLPGTLELAERGFVPGGSRRNREAVADRVSVAPGVPALLEIVLCDAQTSGGLLLAVPPDEATALESALRAEGLPAAEIGEITTGTGRIEVR